MLSVFLLRHVHSSGDEEDIKSIVAYSPRGKAQSAIERLGRAPGFSSAMDGFHIDECHVDQDHRVEGYVTLTGVDKSGSS